MLTKVEKSWAAAILFMNGWFFALPVAESGLPIWLTAVQLVHGVFLHEVLFLGYLVFFLVTRGAYLPSFGYSVRRVAFLIAGLGALGVLSALANFRPVKEFIGAGRYFLLAIYFLASIYWAKKYGPTFVLRNLLLGIVGSGAMTLLFTFTSGRPLLGGLPMLMGQNGPGGYMGIGVVLGAWLMMERKTLLDATIAVAACVIGVFGASISFSKLAMLMAGSGVIGWAFVIFRNLNLRHSRRWSAVMLAALTVIVWMNREAVDRYLEGVNRFIELKFVHLDYNSVGQRSQYFSITNEILWNHPLLGVSYGGFYDAASATKAYQSLRSAKEDPEAGARGETNPHSSFLYYASANGLPGLAVAIFFFFTALRIFGRALSRRGIAGIVLWGCLAFGYLIFGLTLPTLFNTSILYLPIAFALCTYRQTRLRTLSIRGQQTRQDARV
jgi:hypothetical protein